MFRQKAKGISVSVSTEKCVGCGQCVERCRKNAMGLVKLKNEVYAMVVNPANCTGCGKCAKKCKFNAIEITESNHYLDALVDFL